MNIENYYQNIGDSLSFTREQASNFAKGEAGDFNPIHNVDARRFCVPGDLLFSVAVHSIGLYQSMSFEFVQIVTDTQKLSIVRDGERFFIQDEFGKVYLKVVVSGERSDDPDVKAELSRAYICLLYTSPSPRDATLSRMPSSA